MKNIVQTAGEELAKPHHGVDDAEHRLDGLFAQGVGRPTFRSLEPMGHALHRGRIGWRVLGVLESLRPMGVVLIVLDRDRWLDPGRFAGTGVGVAEIVGVSRQLLGLRTDLPAPNSLNALILFEKHLTWVNDVGMYIMYY